VSEILKVVCLYRWDYYDLVDGSPQAKADYSALKTQFQS
jgi:hypothetical protein